MVCLSSGEFELVALLFLELARVSQRETNGAKSATAHLVRLFCARTAQQLWDSSKRKGASGRTRHVATKVYFMQAREMEPGQRILKVHGDSQQVADCLTKIMTPQAARLEPWDFDRCSILSNIDEGVRKIALHPLHLT